MLPLFLLAMLLPILVTAMCCQELTLQDTARNAARLIAASSLGADTDAAVLSAVREHLPSVHLELVTAGASGDSSVITIRVSRPASVPLIPFIRLPFILLSAQASMLREPPLALG